MSMKTSAWWRVIGGWVKGRRRTLRPLWIRNVSIKTAHFLKKHKKESHTERAS